MRSKPTVSASRFGNRMGHKDHLLFTHPPTFRDGFGGPLNPPRRRTTGVGHRSVTLVHTTRKETKAAPPAELALATKACKPNQVFWVKRLEGLQAMVVRPGQSVEKAIVEPFTLEGRLKPAGPRVTEDVALISMVSQLNQLGVPTPIYGQTAKRSKLESKADIYTDPYQPLMEPLVVTNEDISAQQQRVIDARTRLEMALKHFG